MNYTFRDVALNQKEFNDLKWCVGEYRRICREQSDSVFGKERYKTANGLAMFLDEVERLNYSAK